MRCRHSVCRERSEADHRAGLAFRPLPTFNRQAAGPREDAAGSAAAPTAAIAPIQTVSRRAHHCSGLTKPSFPRLEGRQQARKAAATVIGQGDGVIGASSSARSAVSCRSARPVVVRFVHRGLGAAMCRLTCMPSDIIEVPAPGGYPRSASGTYLCAAATSAAPLPGRSRARAGASRRAVAGTRLRDPFSALNCSGRKTPPPCGSTWICRRRPHAPTSRQRRRRLQRRLDLVPVAVDGERRPGLIGIACRLEMTATAS